MDAQASEQLLEAIEGHEMFADELLARMYKLARCLPSYAPELYDVLSVVASHRSSLKITAPALRAQLPWSIRTCSSLIDDAVYGRGLILDMLYLSVTLGLVSDEDDGKRLIGKLLAGSQKREIIVAYIDILGQTDVAKDSGTLPWHQWANIGRNIAKQAQAIGLSSYYWRSSDTYYVFGSIEGDDCKKTEHLVQMLIDLQESTIAGNLWMWQMGISIGESSGIGDIYLPHELLGCPGKLMESAISADRNGGLILIDGAVHAKLSDTIQARFQKVPPELFWNKNIFPKKHDGEARERRHTIHYLSNREKNEL